MYRTNDKIIDQDQLTNLMHVSGSKIKKLHIIENADHFDSPFEEDFMAIKKFISKLEHRFYSNQRENQINHNKSEENLDGILEKLKNLNINDYVEVKINKLKNRKIITN